jgi:hypothetical protein
LSSRFAFFSDEDLAKPYNPFGWNTETGAPDPDNPLMPDALLINKIYLAFAARVSPTAVLANADLSLDAGFFTGPTAVYDTVIACSFESLLVDYTWFNGTVADVHAIPAPNGTISEIWHGSHIASTVSGTSSTLQTMLKQAAVQNSSSAFANTWADLYSPVIMATVGGVSSARGNTQQQTRSPVLVIKVSIPALVFLGWCCLGYIAAGCLFAVLAVRTSSRGDVKDAKMRLTLFGLVAWAVSCSLHGGAEDLDQALPKEQDIGPEKERVRLQQSSHGNFYFQVSNAHHSRGASHESRWI